MLFKPSFIPVILYALSLGAALTCVVAASAHARQETYLPAPFVPWLEDQGFSRAADEKAANPAGRNREAATGQKPPPGAVLTPEDTRALLARIAGDQALAAAPSALEQAYADRIIDTLPQFGYDMFEAPRPNSGDDDDNVAAGNDNDNETQITARPGIPAGAVQDDFTLSIGDRLSVIFRGQRQTRDVFAIDNRGLLVVDDLPPISAAGRSIGDIRAELEAMAATLHNTQVFIALDQVRQIDILIVGEVEKPGRQTLTVFHSVIDALGAAGGVRKTGSLRQIKLIRHGRSTVIDLYGLLVHGSANMDLALQDGDKLVIPPIGPTIGVAGGVKRPGIYELLPQVKGMLHEPGMRSRKISLGEALEMAGGVLSPGQNRFLKLSLTEDGRETVEENSRPFDPLFGDGSILMVAPSREARAGTVELTGHTRRPGIHDLDKVPALSDLLGDKKVFGPDIYPLIGVIERWNDDQMAAQLIDFPPLLVAKGQFDRKLQDGDVVHLFARDQILHLQSDTEAPAQIEPAAGSVVALPETLDDPVMIAFLRERSAFVRGAVRREGAYPVAAGASLENVIAVAGGLALEASTKNIEITSSLHAGENGQSRRGGTRRLAVDYSRDDPGAVMLAPGDTVRVNQKFHKIADNSVQIVGEIAHPGRYDLMPGDRLSDLLRRAGGLTRQAYPDGAIFSREGERKAEESRFRAAARDLERALAVAMEDPEKAPDSAQIAMARDLAAELRQEQAVGRITVEADPGMLATQPELDILLEPGDRIFIPARPLTVRVNGEVLSPASLQFRKEKDARDYINQAGGYTYHADKDRVFVLYPDGSAQPLQVDSWNHSPVFIPPGAAIVVPRDPKPFSFIESARDITQILSNLAITGIFLDDLRDN